ncbi:bifunctional 4-hydroxy-2-oxoglutarate aldolase/2-dehydro-3-deoxy-phosphogluconate aldolase [Planctomycetota bacterium]
MHCGFKDETLERIHNSGVIAVLVIDRVEDAVPLASALVDGGVDIMELTLRTPAAIDALHQIKAKVPKMIAGIGTVLTIEQVMQITEAGAAFGVAPGLNPRIITEAQRIGLPFAPGIATPSDIERSIELGCRLLKFFPAEAIGGLSYLKSIAAPYAHRNLLYIPLGGVNADNMESYLQESTVLAVGGSWIAPRKLIENRNWQAITENARQASRHVKEIRERGTK